MRRIPVLPAPVRRARARERVKTVQGRRPSTRARAVYKVEQRLAVNELAVAEPTRAADEAAPVTPEADAKELALRALCRELGAALVAYSGGVDSTYVAYIATAELGARALCVTGDSPSLAAHQ